MLRVIAHAGGLLVAWTLGVSSAFAQAPAPSAQAPAADLAWVRLDGRPLFALRGLASYSAERRAAEVSDRVLSVARDASLPPSAVQVVSSPAASDVVAGTRSIVSAIERDADTEGVHRDVLAEAYARRIRGAIESYRYERSTEYLQGAALRAVIATVAFILTFWVALMVMRRFERSAEARYKHHVHDISFQSLQLFEAGQIWSGVAVLLRSLRWLAGAVIVYLYVEYVLNQFPWTREFAQQLLHLVLDPLTAMGRASWARVPDVVFLLVLYVIVRYLLRLTRLFFNAVEQGSIKFRNFYPDWAVPTYRGVRLLIVLIAVVIAYPHIPGSQSEAFKGLSILVGLMVSIGSSSFIANMIAGYALTYRRAFMPGEWVEIGDMRGQVTQTRLQVTHLRTLKNEEVIVPNSFILTSPVINYSKLAGERGLILHTTVGIGYETPWRQVEAMLLLAAQRTTSVQKEPAPFVLQRKLGDFAIEYEINVFCNDAGLMARGRTELHRNILDVFNEYGIQIMTPAYEGDPEQPKVVARDQWFPAPAQPGDAPAREASESEVPSPCPSPATGRGDALETSTGSSSSPLPVAGEVTRSR